MADTPRVRTREGTIVRNPPLARLLFEDTRFSVVWLVVRALLGWTWLNSGLGKLGDPAWMQTGEALRGFWERAAAVPEGGRPPIAYDWYRAFIQSMLDAEAYTWFAKIISLGETLVTRFVPIPGTHTSRRTLACLTYSRRERQRRGLRTQTVWFFNVGCPPSNLSFERTRSAAMARFAARRRWRAAQLMIR